MTAVLAAATQEMSAGTVSAIEALTRQIVADQNPSAGGGGSRDIGGDVAPATGAAGETQRFFGLAAIATSLITNVVAPKVIEFIKKKTRDVGAPQPDNASVERDFAELIQTLVPTVISALPQLAGLFGDNHDAGPDLVAPEPTPDTPVIADAADTTDRGWGWFKSALKVAVPLAVKFISKRNIDRGLAVDDPASIERDLGDVLSSLLPALLAALPSGSAAVPTPTVPTPAVPVSGNGSGSW